MLFRSQVTAELVNFGAFSSRVKYFYQGMEYDEIVMNDDFIPYSELGFEYESYGSDNESE